MRAFKLALTSLVAVGIAACSNETKVTGVEPNTGTFAGGEEVEIMGANFPRGGVSVRFGTHEAQPAVMQSDHTIKVQTPAGDKNSNTDITVVFDDGRAFQLKSAYRYIDTTQQRNTMDKFFNKAAGEKK
jgi:hypothetical protein